jgi:iron complex outermembrane receptor protein
MALGNTAYGDWRLKGLLNYTSGKNLDTDRGLYNIMPLNAKLTLTQKMGDWNNALELLGVSAKDDVSAVRNEVKTPGYSLVNLRASYAWKQASIDFGIENLFDTSYYLPLGGAYTGQGATMSFNREVGNITTNGGTASLWGTGVPGMGRSVYVGVNVKF